MIEVGILWLWLKKCVTTLHCASFQFRYPLPPSLLPSHRTVRLSPQTNHLRSKSVSSLWLWLKKSVTALHCASFQSRYPLPPSIIHIDPFACRPKTNHLRSKSVFSGSGCGSEYVWGAEGSGGLRYGEREREGGGEGEGGVCSAHEMRWGLKGVRRVRDR